MVEESIWVFSFLNVYILTQHFNLGLDMDFE